MGKEEEGRGGGEGDNTGRGGGEVELKASIPQFCLYIRI